MNDNTKRLEKIEQMLPGLVDRTAVEVEWLISCVRALEAERDRLVAKCAEMKQVITHLAGQKCFGPLPDEFGKEPKGYRDYEYCRECEAELDVESHKPSCQVGAAIGNNPGQPLLDRLEKLERARQAALQFRKPWNSDDAPETRQCDILILDEALAALKADSQGG